MDRRRFAIALAAAGAAVPAAARPAASPAPAETPERLWDSWVRAPGLLGRADALVVLRKGQVVFERYGADHGPNVRHVSWSMAKSITAALAGVAVGEGAISLDSPLRTLPRPHPGLRLRHLLTLTDGLDWDEAAYSVVSSDATRMLYGTGRKDGAAYTAAKGQAVPPGTRWNYSTGAFQLAAAELQAALFPGAKTPEARRTAMAAWMRERLFAPLGMTTALAEFDTRGGVYGGSLVYASALDFARFGQLHLQDGVWEGRPLLPPGWVRFCRTPTVAPWYGAGFWLEASAGVKGDQSLTAGQGPRDAFSAEGHEGQVIMIVPSKTLVIVRLAWMPERPGAWPALGGWLARLANGYADV